MVNRERANMVAQNRTDPFKVGAVVRIRDSGYGFARIVEDRGPLGPKGARVYRLRVGKKAPTFYIEVLEEQLEEVPADN